MRYEYDTTCRLYNIGRTKRYGEDDSDAEENEGEEQTPSSLGNEDEEQDDDDGEDELMDFFTNYMG